MQKQNNYDALPLGTPAGLRDARCLASAEKRFQFLYTQCQTFGGTGLAPANGTFAFGSERTAGRQTQPDFGNELFAQGERISFAFNAKE